MSSSSPNRPTSSSICWSTSTLPIQVTLWLDGPPLNSVNFSSMPFPSCLTSYSTWRTTLSPRKAFSAWPSSSRMSMILKGGKSVWKLSVMPRSLRKNTSWKSQKKVSWTIFSIFYREMRNKIQLKSRNCALPSWPIFARDAKRIKSSSGKNMVLTSLSLTSKTRT